ncbi:MAG: hypothetical protein ABI726_02535 [bacterium]
MALALAILAETAFAGTIDLGTVGGVNYSGNSSSAPIVPNGVEIGPDAECASGTRLVGGGVEIGGDFAESQFTRSAPGDESLASGQSWVTVWANLAGSGKTASVTAACMDREVRRQFLIPPGVTITTDAGCPTGAHVVGGGVRLGGAASEAHPVAMNLADDSTDANTVPDDSLHVVVGNAPSTDPKPIRMYAVCRT